MAMAQLIQSPTPVFSAADERRHSKARSPSPSEDLSIEALRLIELSDRVSAVMKSSASESLLLSDPLLAIFRMFGELHDLPISTALSIVTFDDLAYSVTEHARNNSSDMIILPWLPTASPRGDAALALHEHGGLPQTPGAKASGTPSHNPFDALFKSGGAHDKSASALHAQFVRGVFSRTSTDVALFVNQEESVPARVMGSKQHLFMVFFGGPDDRLALEFVVQLCASPNVTATVLRMIKREVDAPLTHVTNAHLAGIEKAEEATMLTVASAVAGFPDTVYGHPTTETRMQSETADNVAWAKYASPGAADVASMSSGASRIEFCERATPVPLHAAISEVKLYQETASAEARPPRVLVVVGRSRRLAVENHAGELKELAEEYGSVGVEVRKTMGDVASAFVVASAGAGLVVVQATEIRN